MKYFLDCGSHCGESVIKFRNKYSNQLEYEIHCFEADPTFSKCYSYLNVHFHNVAVWIKNTTLSFYKSNGINKDGGTVLKNKITGCLSKLPVLVEAIDFDSWINDNCVQDSEIILKLDVEGAEYDILEHLISKGSIRRINALYVEFHSRRLSNFDKNRHKNLLLELNKLNIHNKGWDALDILRQSRSLATEINLDQYHSIISTNSVVLGPYKKLDYTYIRLDNGKTLKIPSKLLI